MVSVDVKHHVYLLTAASLPVPNSPYGLCGRKATLNGSVPFPPVSLQRQVVLFADVAGVHVFITGESLHYFLVGWCTNKSYVIATSDLWLFIHASNLLPLIIPALYNRLGFSVSMTTSLLVDCYSVYATTSIFHFPERCGDPSLYIYFIMIEL